MAIITTIIRMATVTIITMAISTTRSLRARRVIGADMETGFVHPTLR
jgi:hypothetical protein